MNFRLPDNHVMQRLKEIFSKFDLRIQRFQIFSSLMSTNEMTELLNYVQNVEEIAFYDVELFDGLSEDLELEKLRKFKFHLCNVGTARFLLKLQRDVLHFLSIENCILDKETLRKIFENQRNLAELEFDPYYVDPSSMEQLKLKKMKLMCNRHVAVILRSHKDINSLDLSKAHIGDNEFLEVCKLHQLKSLKLWIDRVSWEILENLTQLKSLNALSLNYDRLEVEYMRSVGRIQMTQLRQLKIKFPRLKILSDNFSEMSRSFPNLTHLHVSNQSIGVFGVLIESFKNLETLILGCDSDSPEVVEFPVNDVKHEKLKELCIYSSHTDQKTLKCSKTILEIINKLAVGLEKLKLHNVISLSGFEFEEILVEHKSLTHFYILSPDGEFQFDEDFAKVVKENSKQLQYFQSSGAKISIHKKILEKDFNKLFSHIQIKPRRCQIILKNCNWPHVGD